MIRCNKCSGSRYGIRVSYFSTHARVVSAHQVEGGNGQSEGERGSWGRLNRRLTTGLLDSR